MKILPLVYMLFAIAACHTTKPTAEKPQGSKNEVTQEGSSLQFGCYESSDTLKSLVAYFPEEKIFYINNTLCKKEDLCHRIQYDINMNKGVLHYYAPESNFMFMISIVREIEKCYKERIEVLSLKEFGTQYNLLSPEQKAVIDSKLSYSVESN